MTGFDPMEAPKIESSIEPVERVEREGEWRACFEPRAVQPSLALVAFVAAIEDVDVLELPALGVGVDAVALDRYVESLAVPGRVVVEFAGYEVTVSGAGDLRARPVDAE